MLNELVFLLRSARYPYNKRSPQPLITSAFKNVFLQTLQTYLRLQAVLAQCLEIAVAPQMICWTKAYFTISHWDCGQTVVEA